MGITSNGARKRHYLLATCKNCLQDVLPFVEYLSSGCCTSGSLANFHFSPPPAQPTYAIDCSPSTSWAASADLQIAVTSSTSAMRIVASCPCVPFRFSNRDHTFHFDTGTVFFFPSFTVTILTVSTNAMK